MARGEDGETRRMGDKQMVYASKAANFGGREAGSVLVDARLAR